MDYTTLERVKLAARISENTDDVLLSNMISAASRALDRRCTGVADESAHNYFALEDVVGEVLTGQVSVDGSIFCYPHKPAIKSVSSFSFQENIIGQAYTVDTSRVEYVGLKVRAYPTSIGFDYPCKCRVTISYTGGFSGSAASLPDDLQELCTLLAIRLYREHETGYSDVIGIPELATKVYSKAWPIRLESQLDTFIRKQGWNSVA